VESRFLARTLPGVSSVEPGTLRVAVIETDRAFIAVLAKRFERAAWQHRFLSSAPPPERLLAMKLNALVLDLGVLGPMSWDFLERVSGMMPGLAVVVCTQGSTVAQRVRGLRLGADDWINKPCHPEEVMARVEASVRRRKLTGPTPEVGPMVAGELEVRPDQFQGYVADQSLGLTRREFELLHVLAAHPGRAMEREDLYRRVWGYEMAHGDRSVDVFVRKLRAKIMKRSPGWSYIHTHVGIGYRFDPKPVAPTELPEPAQAEGNVGRESAGPDTAEPATAESA
jgi:DNA-binding response OmpR family regulator